jgi:hypothetical protein
MPIIKDYVGSFVLMTNMDKGEYLEAIKEPPGDLVGGPSITNTGGGVSDLFAQLFKIGGRGGTRHRRKRNKKTRKSF